MNYLVESDKPVARATDDLKTAVAAHGFGVLHEYDLKATLAGKGFELPNECRILEICNPQQAPTDPKAGKASFRAPEKSSCKAHSRRHGGPHVKRMQRSRWASLALPSGGPLPGHPQRCAFLKWGPPFLRTRALRLTRQRPAE